MQIKSRRGTTTKGLLSKTQLFTLTMIAEPTAEDHECLTRWNQWPSTVGSIIDEFGDANKPLYGTPLQTLLQGYQWTDASLKRLQIQEQKVLGHCADILNWCRIADTYAQDEETVYQVEASGSTEI